MTTTGSISVYLENGIDERFLHTKLTPKSELLTPECVTVVESILAMKYGPTPSVKVMGRRLSID